MKAKEKKMKNVTSVDELYVLGHDEKGKPRGARFPECKDPIVSAVLGMGCTVVYPASSTFAEFGMKLPRGRLYASGKAFVPNIRRDLFDKLTALLEGDQESQTHKTPIAESSSTAKVPMSSSLPKTWEEITVGHMVLIHESPADGWWEAVVIERNDEVLKLRFRDYPKLAAFDRHISTIALVNPGA